MDIFKTQNLHVMSITAYEINAKRLQKIKPRIK